jgi:hypothetical protein
VRRRSLRAIALVLLIVLAAAAITPLRHAALRGAGRFLTATDAIRPADLLVMDLESSLAGILKIDDLYRAQPTATVGLLVPGDTPADTALQHRGVVRPEVTLDILVHLGVPRSAIVRIPAGEGGTTDTTGALAEWARAHPTKTVLVVVGPSHGRRYRRALGRAWPVGLPRPIVVTTDYALFRADDWWRSRTTVREGIMELEKLALDYVAHPW